MNTPDPQSRNAHLPDVERILAEQADPADQALLTAFSTVIWADLPDPLLRLEPEEVANRIGEAYRFVVHTVPPPFQVYKGAPGLHVTARNSGPDDVTIIETHTPHVPFIFESLKNFLQQQGLRVLSAVHPLFTVRRQWERVVYIGDADDDGARELYCQFRIERIESRDRLRRIEHQVHAVLKSVFLAVEDFQSMRRAVTDAGMQLRFRAGSQHDGEGAHGFLNWLVDDNFVLLGTMSYYSAGGDPLEPDWRSALGVFRDPTLFPVVFPGLLEEFGTYPSPETGDDRAIDVDYRAGAIAIHYLEPLDAIVIRERGHDDRLARATLLIGRLAKSAFSARPQDMPLLREKLTWLLEQCGAAARSHAHRATRAFFNQFPKRELLYADGASLKRIIDLMIRLSGDDDFAVATRRGVGYQALHVAFSKVHYSHRVEEDLTAELAREVGPVSFHTWADCGDTTLLVFYFSESAAREAIDLDLVRRIVEESITTWEVRTAAALDAAVGPTEGRQLFTRYIRAEERSGLYREITTPEEVPEDLQRFEQMQERLEMRLLPDGAGSAIVKLFSPAPLELVDTLRTLEQLGLSVREEVSVPLVLPEGRPGFLQRLRVQADPRTISRLPSLEGALLDALRALHEGRCANDPLNGLLTAEGLHWRSIELLRTVRNYLLQVRPQYTSDTLTAVLLANSRVSAALFRVFAARFDPTLGDERGAVLEACEDELEVARAGVGSLLHDEMLDAVDNVIRALVRTNFYQQPERPVVSVKVESRRVHGLPQPRPLYEIYVHSPRLEGIHLRGGRVARGGIRWSDRPDDFRAEVLGLMKTQMLKNAIIVPVGSKGGFVLKGIAVAATTQSELADRYREFISGLLDVTDNRVGDVIEHPPSVVRHDADDPYLVVAADKGTAHLSDTANQVSAQYGFWLGDAFASGGSNGYDHKKEGITARGVGASVEHHFQTLGIDPERQPFTVVGIGDMSGDVFGNGMLRSRMTKLVGAFNHQHIFLDPDPDPDRSFGERQRLFEMPRSTWREYDVSAISSGGGVFDRQAKSIPLAPEARRLLGVEEATASGEEVIRRLLSAKVDLLYNGGIGTYVKASEEDAAAVADRANDRVRVNAADLRARVVAEGGNLGLTDRARIEYWAAGGRINTDALDNSAGVSMSDHEVNIKILVDLLLRDGRLTRAARNRLLITMTEEGAELVLDDNTHQARALTLDSIRSTANYDDFLFVLDHLVSTGAAGRGDSLPTRDELAARTDRQRGFPRPVLAVAMALTKNWGRAELLKAPLIDGPLVRPFLERYFPSTLRDQFADRFEAHPLRREIIATVVVSHVVNHAGISLIPRLMVATGKDLGAIVDAYLAAEHARDAARRRQD